MASALVALSQGGVQALTATPSRASGTPGLGGVVRVTNLMRPFLTAPLFHGPPGRITLFRPSGPSTASQAAVADFYGWRPNTVTVKGLSTYTLPTTTRFVSKGSFALTPQGGGTVTLVAPAKLWVVGPASVSGRVHSRTTLTLHFVPEPGALVLIAVAVLSAARRWRGPPAPRASRRWAPTPR